MLQSAKFNPMKGLGGGQMLVAGCRINIGAAGAPTMAEDANGHITVSQATNDYTITFPDSWTTTHSIQVTDTETTANLDGLTFSESAGTVTLEYSGQPANGVVIHVTLFCSVNDVI